ncbi:unnamed protein product, partial [Iphiclides podalirius]
MYVRLSIAVILVLSMAWQAQAAVNCTATGAGRFANPDDTTCQNYTLCVYVSSSSSYLSYNYVCPSTSVFDPDTSKCTDSSNYACNVTTASNTTSSSNATTYTTSITSACTDEGYFADPSSTNCSTYIECILINGTYTSTTYTCPDDTLFNPNTTLCEADYNCTDSSNSNDTFSCTTAGRFANPEDNTCQTYYLCVLVSNGSYVPYEYTCPTSSVFNPNTAVCTASSNYVCNVTATSNTTNTTSVCTADGYFADPSSNNCSSYIECISINDTYTETTYSCPDDTLFNPNTTLCEDDYNCTDTSDTTDNATTTFNCTEAGRFANPDDTTCQTYYLCTLLSNGTYVQNEYTCPTSAVFNPNSALCTASSNYVCNVTTTSNSSSVCTADGYVADPSSTNCTAYIECVEINGTYTETTLTCPDDTFFDPNTTLCELDYNCTSSDNTTTVFSCTDAGRFANTADTTCQTYYFCVSLNNGTYAQYEYTCPSTSVFSPTAKVCTTSYTCTTSSG